MRHTFMGAIVIGALLCGCQQIADELGIGDLIPKPSDQTVTIRLPIAADQQQYFHFESKSWQQVPLELLRLQVEAEPVGGAGSVTVMGPLQSSTQGEIAIGLKPGTYNFVVSELASSIIAQSRFKATVTGNQTIQVKTRPIINAIEVIMPTVIKPGQEEIAALSVRNDEFRLPPENPISNLQFDVEGLAQARLIAGGLGIAVTADASSLDGDVIRLTVSADGFDGAGPSVVRTSVDLKVRP
jgi:hypothetical protein